MFNSGDDSAMGYILGRDSSNDGFGGNNGWWIILLIIVLCGGYGNGNGVFGGGSSTGSGLTDGYILTSDFANIERKIDGVNNGLCDGFYAMNTGMLNGFAGVNSSITQQSIAQMQDTNALSRQLADCCCENRSATADLKYTMATDTCATNTNIANATRDIIDNDNANYRALDARLTQMEMNAKDEKISDQQSQIFALQLAASQSAQNNFIIDQLSPTPKPAYIVQSPYANYFGNNCNSCSYGTIA